MDSIELQELVRPQDTRTFASDQQVKLGSLPHKAEVLGYVSAHRSISPELLRPLALHSKRSSSSSMGASCSKSSSVGLSSKVNQELRSSNPSISSPYLTSKVSSSKLSKAAQSPGEAAAGSGDLLQAQHQPDPAGQLQNALAASAAAAVLSEASDYAATSVAAATLPQSPQQRSIAQQSLLEAAAVYKRPLDRPAHHHKTALGKKGTASLMGPAPFPDALKAVVQQPSEEGFIQLLQQHLFESQDMKVMDMDSLVGAIAGQPAQTQASCASLMVANAFYFAAMKAVFVFPDILKAVLDDIHLQVDVQQQERVDSWRWADSDLRLLLQQFRGLRVTQQYKQTQQQLSALGPEGQAPLARVQMEMLGKVVNDFLAQLDAQLSRSQAAAETAPGVSELEVETEAESSWSKPKAVDSGKGVSKGWAEGRGGSKGGAGRGQVGGLTSSQVKKKTGLQQRREQLKAGERHKRQQATALGVSPTVVARSQMSARSVAQQQVLTQRGQQREGTAAVAQRAAAEKLQLEQQALERDYEQLRREQLRFEEEQQWAAQQQAQPFSSSQPQAQSRFAQHSMLPVASAANPKDQAPATIGFGSIAPAPLPGPISTSSLTEESGPPYATLTQEEGPKQASMPRPAEYDDDSMASQPAQRRGPTQHAMSELEQKGGAAVNSPAGQTTAARRAANPDEVAALSAPNPRGGHRSQHTLSEQEHQGSSAKARSTVQGSVAQPHLRGPSPQEVELIASHQATGRASPTRDSPTRDLTELEQQGSFTLTPDPSQSQAGNLDGSEAAEMAWELARRKGAQAKLERQYSQLQLQHQQSLEKHHQQAKLTQQAQLEEDDRLQQELQGKAEEQRLKQQRAQQEQARLDAELARQQAEEEDHRQQQAMAREAKELAKQRAALEAALAAERVDAQGHGYTPNPLATPKPVQGGSNTEDTDISEVEEEAASGSDEEEVSSEGEASEYEDEVQDPKHRSGKPVSGKVEDAASSSVESDAGESEEDYQEDFEDEEGQASAAATAQKKTLQSRGSGAAGRKANSKKTASKQRRTSSSSPKPVTPHTPTASASDSPDPTALKWAAKNPWFGTDVEMTYFAYEVHDQLIEEEQITADMPEYYTLISARVEAQFPERFFLPGSTGMQRQGTINSAGAQVSTAGVPTMYRQGSSIGSANYQNSPNVGPTMYRQSSSIGSSIYHQGSIVGPAVFQQDLSLGPGLYSQASFLAPQLPGGTPYAPRLYRGSSAVAALSQQQLQDQLRAVAAKRPAVPALPLPQGTSAEASPRLAGPRSDRGVGSLYDKKTGTPRVDAASSSPTSRVDLGNQVASDMTWAVGQRADMA